MFFFGFVKDTSCSDIDCDWLCKYSVSSIRPCGDTALNHIGSRVPCRVLAFCLSENTELLPFRESLIYGE